MGRTWSTCDWRSSARVACTSTCLCVCSGWTLWTYSVTEINLVILIYFNDLVPCMLLNVSIEVLFCKKFTLSNSWFVAVFRVLHFTTYETTILRCGGLYRYCLVYQVFLHIWWKFDENMYTITQIMTKNVRFLFSIHSVFNYNINMIHTRSAVEAISYCSWVTDEDVVTAAVSGSCVRSCKHSPTASSLLLLLVHYTLRQFMLINYLMKLSCNIIQQATTFTKSKHVTAVESVPQYIHCMWRGCRVWFNVPPNTL